MDAYQYFFDADGNQTGYQQVGEMHWDAKNHQHWHFEDFARYRLLDEDKTRRCVSRKQSFCLANTDAVDYTVPGADWQPENTDLSTACGGHDALSVREVLAAGLGRHLRPVPRRPGLQIKNLPNGIYYIAVEANPERNLVESDTTNNVALRKIRIGGKADDAQGQGPAGRPIIEEHASSADAADRPWITLTPPATSWRVGVSGCAGGVSPCAW